MGKEQNFNTFISNPKDSITKIDHSLYFKFIDISPMAIIVHLRGVIVYANTKAVKLMDYKSKKELIGENVMKFVHPDDREIVIDRIKKIYTGNVEYTKLIEERFIKPNGEVIYAEVISQVTEYEGEKAIQVIAHDITERKKTEEELRYRTAVLEAQGEATPDGILIADTKGKIISLNQRFLQMWKIPKKIQDSDDESLALNHAMTQLVDPEGFIERVNYLYMHPNEVSHEEVIFKDGRAFDRYGVPVIGRDGREYGFAWYFRDITERKQYEEALNNSKSEIQKLNIELESRVQERTRQLELSNEELKRSNRELQDFANIASHDLQEPLRKITSFSNLLTKKFKKDFPDNATQYLDGMQRAANRMSKLIEDLLTYSRVTTINHPLENINLKDIIHESLEDLQISIEQKNAEIIIGDLSYAYCDKLQIRLLFQNIISNSLKYSRENINPKIELYSEEKENKTTIYIKDNGIGFDEKYLDKIFTIFQRLHGRSEYDGTGVGLAICKKIIERHNGSLTAHSVVGEGSTFIIELPKQK